MAPGVATNPATHIDANEGGLKDTVRVNPREIVELAIRFQAYSGRHMYHCHILEHEDRGMMRPIVIMPEQLMPFMSPAASAAPRARRKPRRDDEPHGDPSRLRRALAPTSTR